jgi:hypothetical protein
LNPTRKISSNPHTHSTLSDQGSTDEKEDDLGTRQLGQSLKNVTFPGSKLDAIHIRNSRLDKVDLRQIANLGIVDDVFALWGAAISSPQLVDLAAVLAKRAGIVVD